MPQTDQFTAKPSLPGPVANYLRSVNAGARDEFRASFLGSAVVVDVNRELSGLDAITDWADTDIFAAHVRFDVLNVAERQGRTIVTVKVNGTFDRTGLPNPLVMDHEFTLAEGKIAELRIGFEDTLMAYALTGKAALVTGAAKGIGAGIAKAISAAGASVVVNYTSDRPGAERVVADIKAAGGSAFAIQANISVVAEVEHLFAEAIATFGPLDILVNNASVFAFALLEQTTDEELHRMLDTNLWGTIVTCREALKHFGKDGGSIINIGSMSSKRFSAGAVAYTASKAGITGVTGVLAVELASRGIRVNQINPGAVDTEGARAIGAMSDEARAAHIARTPLGRVGTPADIASVAVFLASDEARWITGECLAVSGGLC